MLVFATAIAPVPLPVSVIGVSGWYPEPARYRDAAHVIRALALGRIRDVDVGGAVLRVRAELRNEVASRACRRRG